MKLQAKFTLYFIFLVVITIGISFSAIHWNLQAFFTRFVQEKKLEQIQIERNGLGQVLLIRPLKETPEQRFSRTISDSVWGAGIIVVLLAVIMAYILSNLMLKRMHRLQSAMQQYAKDGKSRAVIHGGNDEIDDLATMYNTLIEKIDKEKRVRQDFFVDMSHELRTPLTSIKGYLEGLIDHVFDREKEKDIHEKTLIETDRMIRLVKEMTTLAKLETEQIKLSKESVDLRKLTQEVWDMLFPESEKRDLQLEMKGEIEADADPYKFKQVIINLLENALHYGPSGSSIVIEMGSESKHLYWRIQNETENVDPQELAYFFERFYRADKARSYDAKKPHLGIGLNIVKKIVEQHGGDISAKMEDRNRIIFEVTLPLLHIDREQKAT